MAKPKKWNEMTPSEQAAENTARATAKAERKAAERAALNAEIAGPANKGKLAKAAKPVISGTTAAPSKSGRPINAGRTVVGGNMDISQADTRVFDFEKPAQSAAPAKPKLNIVTSDAPTEVPTQTYEQPKPQKGKLAKAAKAAKAPAPAAAPDLPNRPLAGQGAMADKPVEKVTVKVSDKLLTKEGVAKWNAAKDADRRTSPGKPPGAERRAAPAKVMTPEGKVESAKAPAKLNPADVEMAEIKRSVKPSSSVRFGGRIAAANARGGVISAVKPVESLGQKFGRAAGKAAMTGVKWAGTTAGKTAIGIAKHIVVEPFRPIAEFSSGAAARQAAFQAAGPVGKAVQIGKTALQGGWAAARTGGRVGKLAAEGLAFDGGYALGTAWHEGAEALQKDVRQKNASGQKHGIKVSAPGYGETLFRSVAGGSPKIKVHDTTRDAGPDGKSLSQKRRERGEAKFAENEYNRVKKAAGRGVITGSYRPKGGSSNV